MRMINGFMTACVKVMQKLYVNIFMQNQITRINWHASSKIMMNHVQLQHSK